MSGGGSISRRGLDLLHLDFLSVDVVRIAEGRNAERHYGMDAALYPQRPGETLRILLQGREHESHIYLADTEAFGHQ